MSFTIAVAGKGGTGKSTLCSLLITGLVEGGVKPVLAVDADANANLHELLGIEIDRTIGQVREDALGSISKVPPGMTKADFIELHISNAVLETPNYDLLVMGRPEGSGCYCYANNLIRGYIDQLSRNYQFVIIDNEAGMEHLSRHTTNHTDLLLLVTDPSIRGLRTLKRISDLVIELKLQVGEIKVVVTRVKEGRLESDFMEMLEKMNLSLGAVIPEDSAVTDMDGKGNPVSSLPADSAAKKAMLGLIADSTRAGSPNSSG